MPIEVSELGPCSRQISITVPKEKVQEAMKAAWNQASQNIQMKGFRPGKIPRRILEKKYGEAVREDVKQQLINDAYREALETHSLSPVAQPEIDGDSVQFGPDEELSLALTVEIRPQFDLPKYKGVEVGAPVVEVTDADVDREVERMRGQRAKVEAVEDGVVAKGDYVTTDVSYNVDGALVLHHEDILVDTNRDIVDGVEISGGTASFAGKTKGGAVTLPAKLPNNFEPAGFAGADAQLLCTVKEIRRVTLPDLDDEFAKSVGAESMDDVKQKMREEYGKHLENERNRQIEEHILDDLIKQASFEVPGELLKRSSHERVHQLEHHLIGNGMSEEEAKANAASQTDKLRQDEARSLRISFILDEIATKEDISVTETEIEHSIRSLAAMQNRDPQKVYDELHESGRLSGLGAQLLETKVRKFLRDEAKIAETREENAGS